MYLNCKTYFSFRYGTIATEKLVKEGVDKGVKAMALTNINNTADMWDFYELCLDAGIKPLLGCEIRNGDQLLYIVIAKNDAGILCIHQVLSQHLQLKVAFPEKACFSNDVWIIYPFGKQINTELKENERIGIYPHDINKLFRGANKAFLDKCVVLQPVTFTDKTSYNLHRLLRAIDKNIILSKQADTHTAAVQEWLVPPTQLLAAFQSYPDIITNTLRLVDSCHYTLAFHTDKNKKIFSATLKDDKELLQKLAFEGQKKRYGLHHKKAAERVEKELEIIDRLGFNAYFLITWDIIRYAQSCGFFYVGRGSGANSIVAYCLQITDVDPIDLDLYFERFLNPYRMSPPDFDIDFSWQDRDEVIDYIFKRYGKDHVALLGMFSTFQHHAVIRELAKVFGLPKGEVDELVNNATATFTEDRIQRQILYYGSLLKNFPNYLSIHPGGMLISEAPIYQYTALELPPKGFATTQIDMFVAEKIGLYKLDILSQRGLGHIKETVRLVKENKQLSIDIHDVERFKKDEKVAGQIKRADTIGCFYIESPAMRQLLLKLKCSDYLTLVAASSIIRPGVAQSGMMREYIYRFHNPTSFEYLHPKMKELLEETYGVMVYQEDVIKVAHHFAGLDMGQADVLRRAMSGKYRSRKEFDNIRQQFFVNCKEREYPDEISHEVWRQIESFGGYSFSKAHSASFAVESYQSLYLKTYFPMEFMVAVINNFGGFYSTELYFHELKRAGATIHAPCVNTCEEYTCIKGNEVYIGFIHLKSLEKETIHCLLQERTEKGCFKDLQDMISRTGIVAEQLNILIRIGALRFTGRNKKELLWEANFLGKHFKRKATNEIVLFQEKVSSFKLPPLYTHALEDAMDEMELLGYPLCPVFELIANEEVDIIMASQLAPYVNKEVMMVGYFITQKPVRTVKGEVMYFGTFIDAKGDWLDTVHFPDAAAKYPLAGKGFYRMKGRVVAEFGVYTLDVQWMCKVGMKTMK